MRELKTFLFKKYCEYFMAFKKLIHIIKYDKQMRLIFLMVMNKVKTYVIAHMHNVFSRNYLSRIKRINSNINQIGVFLY